MLWIAAVALDVIAGEPPARAHPVVWIGRLITWLEARAPGTPRSQLLFGVVVAALPACAAALLGLTAGRLQPRAVRTLASIWLLKTTFSVRGLLDASRSVEDRLVRDDLPGARDALRSLVSRDRRSLDHAHIASAAIESVAENVSDSYIAPLFWYAVGGLPAALAYRAINTADAMVGYRGHYEYLGKATARADDAANYVPARLSGLALVAAAPLAGSDARSAAIVMHRDHARTASPNAGWPMAAAAGALGISLEKIDHYRLGRGRGPAVSDMRAARGLIAAAVGLCTVVALGMRSRP
jgi:adenosylcobinamide-phosphate synthase